MSATSHDRSDGSNLRRRILVVSPNFVLRERLYDLLVHSGFSVKTIESGQRTITTLRHEHPDLILADISVTDCSGWGLADRIRTFNTELPIILIGQLNVNSLDPRTASDIQESLPSDVSEQELLGAIRQHLQPMFPSAKAHFSGTALLVDDEPELLGVLRNFLEVRGCTVVTAQSGEEALERLSCDPSFILLDIKLPGMDGLVTLRKIKALRPDVPVIMGSAVEDEAMVGQAFALGAYDYIVKPYNLRGLQELLLRLNKFSSS